MSYKRIGGLHFLRMGRFGASFYIARRYSTAAEFRRLWASAFLASLS